MVLLGRNGREWLRMVGFHCKDYTARPRYTSELALKPWASRNEQYFIDTEGDILKFALLGPPALLNYAIAPPLG